MAGRKTPTQKTAAIVKALTPKQIQTLSNMVVEAQTSVNEGLTRLAAVLSEPNLPDPVLGAAWGEVKAIENSVKSDEKAPAGNLGRVAKQRMAAAVQARGVKDPDTKGTIRLDIGNGMCVPIRPWRTGVDDAKLEALLRAKGKDPEVGMDATIVYKKNEQKLGALIAAKVITPDELAQCEYEYKPVVLAPEPAKSEEA